MAMIAMLQMWNLLEVIWIDLISDTLKQLNLDFWSENLLNLNPSQKTQTNMKEIKITLYALINNLSRHYNSFPLSWSHRISSLRLDSTFQISRNSFWTLLHIVIFCQWSKNLFQSFIISSAAILIAC